MSTSKATPGPWRMLRSVNPVERWDIGIHAEPNANIHAECYAEFAAKGDVRPGECEANARLIAAAPELRDAMQGFVDWYAALPEPGLVPHALTLSQRLREARALLARLEGDER